MMLVAFKLSWRIPKRVISVKDEGAWGRVA